MATVASTVVCQELASAAVYSEVARHGNACRDCQIQVVIVLTALSRLPDRQTHQHACGSCMLHLYGPNLQHLQSVMAAVSHALWKQFRVDAQPRPAASRRCAHLQQGPHQASLGKAVRHLRRQAAADVVQDVGAPAPCLIWLLGVQLPVCSLWSLCALQDCLCCRLSTCASLRQPRPPDMTGAKTLPAHDMPAAAAVPAYCTWQMDIRSSCLHDSNLYRPL